jgi:hypothetical protein
LGIEVHWKYQFSRDIGKVPALWPGLGFGKIEGGESGLISFSKMEFSVSNSPALMRWGWSLGVVDPTDSPVP